MICLYCNGSTQVVNSRPQHKATQVWRRRKCEECGRLFSTNERIDLSKALMIRKSETEVEPFVREKLLLSIYRSVGHRKTAINDSTAITDTICSKLIKSSTSPIIEVEYLVKLVTNTLNTFDKPAGVHYKAYNPIAKSS
jgi:transcriptional repressor NrdR